MAKAQPFTVDVRPFGPSPEQLDRLRTTLLRERSVRRLAGTGQFRVLSVEAVDPTEETGQKGRPQPPTHYRAMFYDRENARTLIAYGRLDKPSDRSEEHTSELQSQSNLVCRLLLEKKKKKQI